MYENAGIIECGDPIEPESTGGFATASDDCDNNPNIEFNDKITINVIEVNKHDY